MTSARTSRDAVEELLRAMAETVTAYHPEVGRTSTTVEGLIQGTACFPGGAGLWRGRENGGSLPDYFPEAPVMFVGHNFDSQRGYELSLARRGEAHGDFWTRLLRILEAAHLSPESCFFTNVLMGLKPGSAEGEMPSVTGYREQCRRFLEQQIEIVKPRAIVALGVRSAQYLSQLGHPFVGLLHPGDWSLRPLTTRDSLLIAEGHRLREFLGLPESMPVSGKLLDIPDPPAVPQFRNTVTNFVAKEHQRTSTSVDDWGFRIGSRNSFLMRALEQGGKSREEIRMEFVQAFPDSAGKSTFNVFFTDVIRPFGSAGVSRCVRILRGEEGRLHLDPDRANQVKAAVAAGILAEINALEGNFPKRNRQAIDDIVERYGAPMK